MLSLLPMIAILGGLAFYGVLGGADFGAGFWQLTADLGREPGKVREHAHHSMAPVWEANHVWLIFVLTVTWTCYPRAFGSLFSTLSIALGLAGVGILMRGGAYALRTGISGGRTERVVDTVFGLASLLTPFALGAAVGGIASGRVPIGNARGSLFSSWLSPTSVLIGALAIVTGAYLAAVFLCGDAVRRDEPALAESFRIRALGAGAVAGAIAIGGLFVLRSDAQPLYHGLLRWPGVLGLGVSVLAGTVTLALVLRRRYEPARYTAALAVAAIVAGWALAQSPRILPGLTVTQAAAPRDTLVAALVAILAGAVLLFPSLLTLFRLALGGRLTGGPDAAAQPAEPAGVAARRPAFGLRLAGALLIAGVGLVNVADAQWAHVTGALCFAGCVAAGFRIAVPLE